MSKTFLHFDLMDSEDAASYSDLLPENESCSSLRNFPEYRPVTRA